MAPGLTVLPLAAPPLFPGLCIWHPLHNILRTTSAGLGGCTRTVPFDRWGN